MYVTKEYPANKEVEALFNSSVFKKAWKGKYPKILFDQAYTRWLNEWYTILVLQNQIHTLKLIREERFKDLIEELEEEIKSIINNIKYENNKSQSK